MKLCNCTLLSFLLMFFIAESCSKSEKEEVVPKYVGIWERTWHDDELDANLKQVLILEAQTFNSEISVQSGDSYVLNKKFSGTLAVVDNTLEAQIKKLAVFSENEILLNTREGDSNFGEDVFAHLSIHPVFVGAWFLEPGELTLRLDMDGDGSVRGDEGLFVFQK